MTRVVVVVEGECELRLVKEAIAPAIDRPGLRVEAHSVQTGIRSRTGGAAKGGGGWPPLLAQLERELGSPSAVVTTLFDLYRFSWPSGKTGGATAEAAEAAMRQALSERAPHAVARFYPYVQRHEFETYAFVDLDALKARLPPSDHRALAALAASVSGFSPEDIDGGRATAPSRRLATLPSLAVTSSWKLSLVWPAIAEIGLPRIRAACPRFDGWLRWMEDLDPTR
ncbi:MAG: DUF4276 family protein [Myxococcota bacterium]